MQKYTSLAVHSIYIQIRKCIYVYIYIYLYLQWIVVWHGTSHVMDVKEMRILDPIICTSGSADQ